MRSLPLFALLVWTALFADGPAPSLQLRIHVLPHRGILSEDTVLRGVPPRLFYPQGDGFRSVNLQRNGYSEAFDIPCGQPLTLHLPDDAGNPRPVVLAPVIPADWSSALIVVDADAEAVGEHYAHEVFNTSEERLAAGGTVVRNELEHIVTLTIHETKHSIDPGAEIAFVFTEPRVRFQVEEQSGKVRRVATGAFHRSDTCGMLHILRKNSRSTRRIDILTLLGPGK